MLQALLRALGRGIAATLAAIFMPVLHSVGQALATVARWLAIATVVGGGAWYMITYHLNTLNTILSLVIGIAVMGLGFWLILRPIRRPGRQERRRR
jgi:hypothetical protein